MVQVGKSTPGSFKRPEMPEQKKPETTEQRRADSLENAESPEAQQEQVDGENPATTDYFEKLGVKFTEDDFTKLLFNGTFEATIEIRPGLKVKLKTLQAEDFNEVDEKLANMAKEVSMTEEGYRSRFTTFVLSYGLIQINGKNLVMSKSGKDVRASEMADLRYAQIVKMAPAIINAIANKHNLLTMAINSVVGDSKYHLKN